MILINVKFRPKPENVNTFMDDVAEFTRKTREEEGNIFFDWYRSTEDENVYYLAEAFQDDAAEAHVNSQHFKDATELFPQILLETPEIINTLIEGKTEWDRMAEFSVEN
ncbi:putative quinol monooxygenase [Corynebacterium tapiri]|uniref:Antibiotic biosynthesis monooxygenase n=1 Tax=Corynebacterium tapiri TaxID=1448266 RepID=A0A5C4U7V2_9CORY|nr:putative quinol monooxygenase [Corynebacterium tapiri]TNM00451.1 antibiotic biosynthesis monooxygenase [Corynebacterium tapiri]